MKILVTADWHIGVSSFGVLDSNGRNSRLSDIADSISKIPALAKKEQVDMVVHCGDVFHTNRPTVEEQLVFYNFIIAMEQAQIDTHIIIGNHDYNSQLGKGHALKLFKELELDFVDIYDQTDWVRYEDHLFCFYPFAGEEPDVKAVHDAAPHRSFLICHSHLEGAVVGAEPFEIRDDRATKFKDLPFDGVFAGHFHKPQILGNAPLAFYPGSLQPVDFNERNDVKGVVVVNTDDMTWEAAGFKTRRLYQLDLINRTDIPPAYEVEFKDAIVKVVVEVEEADAHTFDENALRNQIMAADAHSIASINLKINRKQQQRDPEIKIDSDMRSNFIRYLKQRDYGDLQDDIQEAGCVIIQQCSQ